MPAAIEVRRVWKAFHDRRTSGTVLALEDISFDVADGEFVVLVGPSGCGKTTMLRILAGLETATAGEVHVASDGPPGMVFQEASVFPWLSVEDNIAYPLAIAGVPCRGSIRSRRGAAGADEPDGLPARAARTSSRAA